MCCADAGKGAAWAGAALEVLTPRLLEATRAEATPRACLGSLHLAAEMVGERHKAGQGGAGTQVGFPVNGRPACCGPCIAVQAPVCV